MRIKISDRRTWSAVNPGPAGFRFFQTALEIAAHQFHQVIVVIQEVGNLLQQWIQPDALLQEFQIGKRDLGIGVSHADSVTRLSVSAGPVPIAVSRAMRQNLRIMAVPAESLEKRIQMIKRQIAELGDLRPGALSKQYNICGTPNCRCKADPPVKHGPCYQISFTRHGKSSSQFVREEDLIEVQQQLENYRLLRELVDEWGHSVRTAFQLASAREAPRPSRRNETPKIADS